MAEIGRVRMRIGRRQLVWRIGPVLCAGVAVAAFFAGAAMSRTGGLSELWPAIELATLIVAVFASVHHADVIAHRTGEPYGTLVLTVAVTVIEVALIVSIMIAGDGASTLARDTVFAVVMVVCNGLVGLCLILGGFKFGEQGFRTTGAGAYLVVLMPLATLTLILPSYTVSVPGPYYTAPQLAFVGTVTVLLYGVFLYVQTIRHRDYFLSDAGDAPIGGRELEVSNRGLAESTALLLLALAAVVLLAKSFADSVKDAVQAAGAPIGAIGLLVALLVLCPESLAAARAARRNELQKSLNLALGSSLATIGLTIPAVSAVTMILDRPLGLGLELRDTALLVLTFAVSLVTFGGGRTNILPGFVHLLLFATYVFLIFVP